MRSWLRERLQEHSAAGAKEDTMPSTLSVCNALQVAGGEAFAVEPLDSQVDVSECVSEVLSPQGVRALSDILQWDVDALARHQPAVLDTVSRFLCAVSV